jgi:ribokinase
MLASVSNTTTSIVVAGSLNMDFVVQVDRLPAPGETVLGGGFQMIPGGKGANQACAAGKTAAPGTRVRMIGRVGYDPFADHLKASLAAAGVDVSTVHATRDVPTGVALIWVERKTGQNSIVVASGANMALTADDISSVKGAFEGARAALFQLESPLPAVAAGMRAARAAGALTILDPAPARPLPKELLAEVDILTPNESEACLLLGEEPRRITFRDAPGVALDLRKLGPKAVILKLGEQGCYYEGPEGDMASAGFAVDAVDTTAAGDTFNAGLSVALAEGLPMETALRFANAAAAISVTRLGAQASAPAREEVLALIGR